jgi:phenylalanyl-tRNA synthetase alpha subunit
VLARIETRKEALEQTQTEIRDYERLLDLAKKVKKEKEKAAEDAAAKSLRGKIANAERDALKESNEVALSIRLAQIAQVTAAMREQLAEEEELRKVIAESEMIAFQKLKAAREEADRMALRQAEEIAAIYERSAEAVRSVNASLTGNRLASSLRSIEQLILRLVSEQGGGRR